VIRLRDTLTGEQRELVPLEGSRVRIYTCGPTVYGPSHVGNFRSFLFADVLVRYLRYRGLEVTWVMNITDIDDKIIKGAAAAGTEISTLTEGCLARFLEDADAVRMTRPDVLPRATQHIDAMVTPTGRQTARSSSASLRGPGMGASPGSIPNRCALASASRPTSTTRTTCATSRSGKGRSAVSRRGTPRSVPAARAGTSSARR
jgi:hypothetical protein